MNLILLVILYITLPAIIIWLCNRNTIADKIGVVIICYIAGIILAQGIPLLTHDVPTNSLKTLQENLMSACIVISLPLMLFSINIKHWIHLGPTTLIAMASSMSAVVIASFFTGWALFEFFEETWKLVGLSISLYIGGTPNLAAVKEALDVNNNLFLQLHTYDTLLTMCYIFFMVSIAQKVFQSFLPSFQEKEQQVGFTQEDEDCNQHYSELLKWPIIKKLSIALVLAALIVAIVVLLAKFFASNNEMAFVMVGLTILAIIASLNKHIRKIPNTFDLGMYIVLCFCVIVGSMITSDLFQQLNYPLIIFVLSVVFGSLILHAIFSKLLNVDTDTFIITSVAAICSPPFVPMVAGALKNKEMLLSGITAGVVGYALSNILAISIAYLFNYMV